MKAFSHNRISDTLGSRSNQFVLPSYAQYRGEPSQQRATNAEPSPVTTFFNVFRSLTTNRLTGDLGQVRWEQDLVGSSMMQGKATYSAAPMPTEVFRSSSVKR